MSDEPRLPRSRSTTEVIEALEKPEQPEPAAIDNDFTDPNVSGEPEPELDPASAG